MFGWLVGKANKKILLAKIKFNNKKVKVQGDVLVDKKYATYYTNEFKIVEIIDEYRISYVSLDVSTIMNDKLCEIKNLKINELYEKTGIFFYINKQRALSDIYLINNNSTGVFKQFLLDGTLQGEISIINGKLNGTYKNYLNGELIEECEYKNDLKNGLCKKYKNNGNIIEFTLWKNGSMASSDLQKN